MQGMSFHSVYFLPETLLSSYHSRSEIPAADSVLFFRYRGVQTDQLWDPI
jgi:hypothetical protein